LCICSTLKLRQSGWKDANFLREVWRGGPRLGRTRRGNEPDRKGSSTLRRKKKRNEMTRKGKKRKEKKKKEKKRKEKKRKGPF
jgi:hypothetical protein